MSTWRQTTEKKKKKIELKIHRITWCWKRQISGIRYLSIHWALIMYWVYEISIETAQVKSDMISVVMWKCIKSKPSFPFAIPHPYITACEPNEEHFNWDWKKSTTKTSIKLKLILIIEKHPIISYYELTIPKQSADGGERRKIIWRLNKNI